MQVPWLEVLLCVPALLSSLCEGRKNYSDALTKSILFYDVQRSGKLPADNPIPWRGDSALDDCVPGGWYDAGDHGKFGLPLSAAATVLGWGLVQFKDGYEAAGQLDMMYDSYKWGMDWILNAWDPVNQEVVVQIGDETLDHTYWGRPEDMTMERPCIKANTSVPATDVSAGYAAALAVSSIGFRDKDAAYADQLLEAAKSLFVFAKTYRGIFPLMIAYRFGDGSDELCEAAAWLYRATNDTQYLDDALSFGDTSLSYHFGWNNKVASCQILLYQATNNDTWKDAITMYLNDWLPGGAVDYTPCGLAWRDKWGSNRWAANTAFLALVAAELGIQPDTCRRWAVEQINYILGDNNHDGGCFSYEIGYGSKYPQSPHHRGASCQDPPAPCSFGDLNGTVAASSASPHMVIGGLVGGPDVMGNYADNRSDYVLNEVALDYNAGFQGALAGIIHLEALNSLPTTNNLCPCDE